MFVGVSPWTTSDPIIEYKTGQPPDQGIISAAIANAAASPATPLRGQENASLFEQQCSKKSSTTKTQFTFTCESDSAKSMTWPDIQSPLSRWDKEVAYAPKGPKGRIPQAVGGLATKDTQTGQNVSSEAREAAPRQSGANNQAPQTPKKSYRSLEKQYKIAARDRRLRQEYSNYHHPPKERDIWICQFCEYESIFGEKPSHLIRQYEAKDRRERKRIAEKRRLLEKAKMKGRKGKKGKNSKNSTTATHLQQPSQKQSSDNRPLDEAPIQRQDVQSEEYEFDNYDDESVTTPVPQQTPSKIPQPISQNQNHSLRPPSGSGALRHGGVRGREAYF